MVVFVVDYLLRVLTVHAVPPRLIYWKNRHKVHLRAVRLYPCCLLVLLQLLLLAAAHGRIG